MKKHLLAFTLIAALGSALLTGCYAGYPAPAAGTAPAAEASKPENDKLVVGFAQIGQESGWRDGETNDIQ